MMSILEKKRLPVIIMLAAMLPSVVLAQEASVLPKIKQTILGLHLTAREAFSKWQADPDEVVILDIRAAEEYVLVGHATMARNIPLMTFNRELTAEKNDPVFEMDSAFIAHIQKDYEVTDTILIMCRSGGRSATAANQLSEAGFTKVYTIIDGFEGDLIEDPKSYFDGKRVKNGWRNSGAPWTYKLEPDLMYHPQEE